MSLDINRPLKGLVSTDKLDPIILLVMVAKALCCEFALDTTRELVPLSNIWPTRYNDVFENAADNRTTRYRTTISDVFFKSFFFFNFS